MHAAGLEAAEPAGVMVHVAADDPEAAAGSSPRPTSCSTASSASAGGRACGPRPARLVDAIDDDAWVIAVDVASGLDPDGRAGDDDAVWADETVTFGTPKPAHLLPAGEAATGRLTVVDIGHRRSTTCRPRSSG